MKKERLYYLDILRVLACLAVIMIHASCDFADQEYNTFNFYIGNLFDSISRFAVPIFVMISGTLFLDEHYVLTKERLKKHIIKLLIFYLFWNITYIIVLYIFPSILKIETFDLFKLIELIFNGYFHLWFIPMIIGLYLITPLLKLWVNKNNIKYVKYFLLLSIIFAFILPQIKTILAIFDNRINNIIILDTLNLNYLLGYTFYYILGWYINNTSISKYKNWNFIFLVSTILTYLLVLIFSYLKQENISNSIYDNFTINILLSSCSLFCIFKNNELKFKNNKIINLISDNTLGIYAIHAGIIIVLRAILEKFINYSILIILITFIISLCISLIISIIFKKIKFLQKVV